MTRKEVTLKLFTSVKIGSTSRSSNVYSAGNLAII